MSMNPNLGIIPCIFLISIGNVLLKLRIEAASDNSLLTPSQVARLFLDPQILLSCAFIGLSIFIWLTISPMVNLSMAYPALCGGVVILTFFLSVYFVKEPVSTFQALGIGFVMLGITLIYR